MGSPECDGSPGCSVNFIGGLTAWREARPPSGGRHAWQVSVYRKGLTSPLYASILVMTSSELSIRSHNSFLSIGSRNSVLSIGSVGSALSIGSVGSFGSVLSVGSFGSVLSLMSGLSAVSMMAWRSYRTVGRKG